MAWPCLGGGAAAIESATEVPPGCFSWGSEEALARNSPPTVSLGERHGRARASSEVGGISTGGRGESLDGAARTGGGEAGELVVVGRAIRSEKARVCGFEPCSFFFPLAVWERGG